LLPLQIHFQFQNERDHDSISFAGVGMKLSELKAAIIQKRGLQTPASAPDGKPVDLIVRNAVDNVGACAACACPCVACTQPPPPRCPARHTRCE
jgi:hypothetical protein